MFYLHLFLAFVSLLLTTSQSFSILPAGYFERDRAKHVLVVGGGGNRGAIPARMVQKLETEDLGRQINASIYSLQATLAYHQDAIRQQQDPSEDQARLFLTEYGIHHPNGPSIDEILKTYRPILTAWTQMLRDQQPQEIPTDREALEAELWPMSALKTQAFRQIEEDLEPILQHLISLLLPSSNRAPLYKIFGTIAGTSTGSIIATALTTEDPQHPGIPMHPDQVLQFYREKSYEIFPSFLCSSSEQCCTRHCLWPMRNTAYRFGHHLTFGYGQDCSCRAACAACWYWSFLGCITECCGLMGEFCCGPFAKLRLCQRCCGPQYDPRPLERILKEQLRNASMGQAMSNLQTTSHSLKRNKLDYCNSHENPDTLVRHAIRKSSAAPTFFGADEGDVDGGVGDNSPVMATLFYAQSQAQRVIERTAVLPFSAPMSRTDPSGASVSGSASLQPTDAPRLEDFFVVSFDTGATAQDLTYLHHGGCLAWGITLEKLLKLLGESNHNHLERMMGENYVRLQPDLPTDLEPMDQPQNVEALIKLTNDYIKEKKYKTLLKSLPGGEKYMDKLFRALWGVS